MMYYQYIKMTLCRECERVSEFNSSLTFKCVRVMLISDLRTVPSEAGEVWWLDNNERVRAVVYHCWVKSIISGAECWNGIDGH